MEQKIVGGLVAFKKMSTLIRKRSALLFFSTVFLLLVSLFSGASFVHAASYFISASVSSGASTGKITTSPAGSPAMNCGNGGAACYSGYIENSSVTITATPAAGYVFDRWSASTPAPCTNSTSATCTFTLGTDVSVSANFNILYNVSASLGGSYGASSVTSAPAGINCAPTCSYSFARGTNVSLTANPASGYNFTSWTNCPSPSGNTCNMWSINMAYGVTANFAASAVNYIVTINKTGAGAGTGTVVDTGGQINCGADCFGSYSTGGITQISATAGAGYTFTGWSGGGCSGTGPCTLVVNSGMTITANFDETPTYYTITTVRGGTYGASSITSSPAGINCGGGGDCLESYAYGTNVTLTASPYTGYVFTGWSGGGCSGTGTCTINVNANVTVTANFSLGYTLTTNKTGAGSVASSITSSPAGINCSPDCSEFLAYGTNVTLTANPGSGYTFTGWSGGGCSGTGTCTVNINGNITVAANFDTSVVNYTLGVTRSGDYGASSVTSSPAGINCGGGGSCSATYSSGTNVSLTANPVSGYVFTGWTNACPSTPMANPCSVAVTSSKIVTASFAASAVNYIVTINKTGAGAGTGTVVDTGGQINCGADCFGSYSTGGITQISATAGAGYTFTGWSGGGCSGTGPCTLVVNSGMTITANFDLTAVPTYTLTATTSPSGLYGGTMGSGIDCGFGGTDCSQAYVGGTNVSLSANPTFGYAFRYFSTTAGISCVNGDYVSPCAFSMPMSAETIYVVFGAPLTVSKAGTGSGTVTASNINCGADCTEVYAVNQSVTLTATPTGGATFAGWSGGGCSGTGTCTVTMDTGKTVTATFTSQFIFAVTKGGAGSLSSSVTSSPAGINCTGSFTVANCSEAFAPGTSVTLTANPGSGYYFSGWAGGGCSGTGTCIVTVNANATTSAAFGALRTATVTVNGLSATSTPSVQTDANRVEDVPQINISCGNGNDFCVNGYNPTVSTTLKATPGGAYWFRYWSTSPTGPAGACAGSTNVNCTFTPTSNFLIDAVFGPKLTLTKAGAGALTSSVTSAPVGVSCLAGCTATSGNYVTNQSVVLTATPAAGYYVLWTGCDSTNNVARTCTVAMSSPKNITATFGTAPTYVLTLTKAGAGGPSSSVISSPAGINCGVACVSANHAYATNTNVTLIAAPSAGYAVVWTGCSSVFGNICNVSIQGARNVTATFGVAALSGDMLGWAWSGNTGWMSLNCQNMSECGSSDYGLEISSSSLRGYVWGGHIGWIYFPSSQTDGNTVIDLSNCPGSEGLGSPCVPPTIDPVTGAVTGWARALAGSDAGLLPSVTGGTCAAVHEDMSFGSCGPVIGSNQVQCDAPSAGYSADVVYADCTTTYSQPAASRFTNQADIVCGVGNWTSSDMGPPWQWPINTVKSFTCNTPVDQGGWSGWIELSGTTHPSPGSGVTYNNTTGALTGYAWGGSVVGWIDFMGRSPSSVVTNANSCDFTLAVANPTISINSGGSISNTITATVPPAAASTYYCDKHIKLNPGNQQFNIAIFDCGTTVGFTATDSPSPLAYSCHRTDDPICYNWTIEQEIDAQHMIGICGAGNYTKLSANSFKCNSVPSCSVNVSIPKVTQGETVSDPDVKDIQFGARTLTPSTLTNTVSNSNLSIASFATTPSGPYTVVIDGISNTGVIKSVNFRVNVTGVGACVNPTSPLPNPWPTANKTLCLGDDDGTTFSGTVTKTLVDTCSNPAGSVPKCQYTCNVGYIRNPATNGCVLAPNLNIKAKPLTSTTYLPNVSLPVKLGDPVDINFYGAGVRRCYGKAGTGDDVIDSVRRWVSIEKIISASSTPQSYYQSLALTDLGDIASTSCPLSGGANCYQFTLTCQNLLGQTIETGPNPTVKTVEIPLAFGSVLPPTCAAYDNRFASGTPLTTIEIGKPVYWIASTTPDRALDGSRLSFSWSGTDDLGGVIGPGNDGVCGAYWCNYQRFVYKSTGRKDVTVAFGDGGPSSFCGPVDITATINTVFDEF